jgi:hypothetical protein
MSIATLEFDVVSGLGTDAVEGVIDSRAAFKIRIDCFL